MNVTIDWSEEVENISICIKIILESNKCTVLIKRVLKDRSPLPECDAFTWLEWVESLSTFTLSIRALFNCETCAGISAECKFMSPVTLEEVTLCL